MKIAVDLQACQTGSCFGGIGRYSMALTKAIARRCGQHQLYVVLSDLMPLTELDVRQELADLVDPAHIVTFHSVPPESANAVLNPPQRKLTETLREDFFRRLRPDVIHLSSLVEGWGSGDRAITSLGDESLAKRTAVTWYDLIPYAQPEMYLTNRDIKAHYYNKIDEAKKAEMLLAISQFTRDEAVALLGLEENRVVNISSGVDPSFRKIDIPESKRESIYRKLGITRPFLLYTGSFDVRKNLSALAMAFAALPSEVRDKYQLVIAGGGTRGNREELIDAVRKTGQPEDALIFAGRVTDNELLHLYNLCHLFVFPSLFEGFGLPPLEAMSCGAAVLGSNRTSIPEVIGWDEALFDPTKVESISAKLHQTLTDDAFRARLIEHGGKRAQQFSWDLCAEKALEAFEEIHARNALNVTMQRAVAEFDPQAHYQTLVATVGELASELQFSSQQLGIVAAAIEANEINAAFANGQKAINSPCVGWVTPWDDDSDLAEYAGNLLASMADSEHLIFAEHDRRDSSIAANVVRCWQTDGGKLKELTKEVNSRDVDVIVIQYRPGLFDVAELNQFIIGQAELGRRIVMMVRTTRDSTDNASSQELIHLRSGLVLCSRILVHSMQDARTLKEIEITRNVAVLPQGTLENSKTKSPDENARSEFRITTHGRFRQQEELRPLIDAFASLASSDPTVRLQILCLAVKTQEARQAITAAKRQIEELQLDDRIELVFDGLSQQESLRRIADSDLVVFPNAHAGDSHASSIRLGITSGTPVAVRWSEICDDIREVVIPLNAANATELAERLRQLVARVRSLADPDTLETLQRVNEWRERRSFANTASLLSQLISKVHPKLTAAA